MRIGSYTQWSNHLRSGPVANCCRTSAHRHLIQQARTHHNDALRKGLFSKTPWATWPLTLKWCWRQTHALGGLANHWPIERIYVVATSSREPLHTCAPPQRPMAIAFAQDPPRRLSFQNPGRPCQHGLALYVNTGIHIYMFVHTRDIQACKKYISAHESLQIQSGLCMCMYFLGILIQSIGTPICPAPDSGSRAPGLTWSSFLVRRSCITCGWLHQGPTLL